jgi:hypothetical protein
MKLYPQLSTAVHNICSTVCSECSADCFCAELILVAAYCTVAPRWHWFVYESFMMYPLLLPLLWGAGPMALMLWLDGMMMMMMMYPLLSTAVHDICSTGILSQ